MFQSLHAMQDFLEKKRTQTERDFGHRQFGAASCEVFDELLRRVHTVTDVFPADTPLTLSVLRNGFGGGVELLGEIATVLKGIADLTEECVKVVYERRQPYIRFISRIESGGYAVDTDTFTTVTDPKDWSVLETVEDAEVRIQLEAEKIACAEQAAVYQQRLERMDEAIKKIEVGYAEQIRALATPTLGTKITAGGWAFDV